MSHDPKVVAFGRTVWVGDVFLPQIRVLREAVLKHMLPALPDAGTDAKQLEESLWNEAMSSPSDGNEDPGDIADWVTYQAIDRYTALSGVRQGATNMAAAMLWHTLEQQAMVFLRREVIPPCVVAGLSKTTFRDRQKVYSWQGFKSILLDEGADVGQLPCSPKLEELRLAANVAKHAAGDSAAQLHKLRPDLFVAPGVGQIGIDMPLGPDHVALPAAGEDLYLTETDLNAYFDAAEAFWGELLAQL